MAVIASITGMVVIVLVITFQGSFDIRQKAYNPNPSPEVILPPGVDPRRGKQVKIATPSAKPISSPTLLKQAPSQPKKLPVPSTRPRSY